jgi:hypothetical protein
MLAGVSEARSDTDEDRPTGKGRPTPKRTDARKRRRAGAPTNRKEAAALRRERLREARSQQRQALLSGDERHLPPRDAGPARRLARDTVDSRFTLGQIFFVLIFVALFISLIRVPFIAIIANLLMLALFGVAVVDAVRVGRLARSRVEAKFGTKESTGVMSYAAMRALQPRRMRRPPAKVKRGATG